MNDLSEVYAFWTGFHQNIDKDYYNWASNKAFRDMARVLDYRKKPLDSQEEKIVNQERKKWREEATLNIKKQIEMYKERDSSFAEFHQKCCAMLKNYYTDKVNNFTDGLAQKWLNMMLKYLWLLYKLQMIDEKTDLYQFIDYHRKEFHVPLDSYILRYVAKKKNNNKQELMDIGLADSIPYHKEFKEAWSKITDDKWYIEYQQSIKEKSKHKYSSPLEWELEHWPKALDYYDGKEKKRSEIHPSF